MKLTKLFISIIALITVITSCGKDDLTTPNNGLSAKGSMLAANGKPDGNSGNNNSGNDNPGESNSGNTNPGNNNPGEGNPGLGNNGNDKPVGNAGNDNPGNNTPQIKPLAIPMLTSNQISYHLGQGSTSVSWSPVTHAESYSVTVNGVPVNDNISPLSLSNREPGTYVVGVRAHSTDAKYSISEEGTISITIKPKQPINTPIISGNVSYTAPAAGILTVNPSFIWPANNKLTAVTFVGSGLSMGTGSINASHNTVANATSYNTSSLRQSNLAPGTYTVTAKAIAGGTYFDDNWVNSAVGSETFTVVPGTLKGKLVDEYGVYTKEYVLTSSFSLPLQLMASRLGTDKTGRDYTFISTATNGANVSATSIAVSNVPHNR